MQAAVLHEDLTRADSNLIASEGPIFTPGTLIYSGNQISCLLQPVVKLIPDKSSGSECQLDGRGSNAEGHVYVPLKS